MLELKQILIVIGFGFLALCINQTLRRKSNGAPYVHSWIPFFGASWHFRKGPLRQLQKFTAQYGPVFNLTLLGKPITYVTDSSLFPTLIKCPSLGLFPLKVRIYERIFGSKKHDDPQVFEFLAKHTRQNILTHLSGTALTQWSSRSHALFKSKVKEELSSTWTQVDVYPWLAPRVFSTLIETFFGQELCTTDFAKNYDLLECKFAALYAGFPTRWIKVEKPRQELHASLYSHIQTNLELVAPIIRERWLFCKEKEVDQAAYQLALIWAMTSNAVRTSFWLLYYLQTTPGAWDAIVNEIKTVSNEKETPIHENVAHCVLLDSAIKETLRLSFSNSVIRVALKDVSIALPSGVTLNLKQGDELMMQAGVDYHDPSRYINPDTFQYDRFARSPELAKDFKPFGLGKFNCPGQYFAMEFLKTAIATLIQETDISLFQGTPLPNYTTAGVYALKDPHAVQMQIRLRTGAVVA